MNNYNKIKLDANESSNIPSWMLNIDSSKLLEQINRYPSMDSDALKFALAKNYNLKKSNFICGNGSDEILSFIFQAFVNQDDNVISLNPSFSMYSKFAKIRKAKLTLLNEFDFNLDNLIYSIKKFNPKLIILCNPNNPTGKIISSETIQKILSIFDGIIILDEAYMDFSNQSFIDKIKFFPNLLITKTFSKAYGLAGLRVGYACGSKKLIDKLNNVKPPYNLNSISESLAIQALSNKDSLNSHIDEILYLKNKLIQFLTKSFNFKIYESSTNFIFISTTNYPLDKYLKEKNIIIRSFENLPFHYRITIGNKNEIEILINSLKELNIYERCNN